MPCQVERAVKEAITSSSGGKKGDCGDGASSAKTDDFFQWFPDVRERHTHFLTYEYLRRKVPWTEAEVDDR